ncbi:YbhQ family protein [Shigella flexneri]
MKWQQRVRVATGLSCWQFLLHLLVVALLVVGWMRKTLVHVGVGLCALSCVTVVMMCNLGTTGNANRRGVADVLEELTTTWFFGAALIVLWLLSRVLENNFLLAIAGLAILAGPAVVSLLAKGTRRLHHLTS